MSNINRGLAAIVLGCSLSACYVNPRPQTAAETPEISSNSEESVRNLISQIKLLGQKQINENSQVFAYDAHGLNSELKSEVLFRYWVLGPQLEIAIANHNYSVNLPQDSPFRNGMLGLEERATNGVFKAVPSSAFVHQWWKKKIDYSERFGIDFPLDLSDPSIRKEMGRIYATAIKSTIIK